MIVFDFPYILEPKIKPNRNTAIIQINSKCMICEPKVFFLITQREKKNADI